MTEPYRKTIDELVARYRLEPDLRDLYVEGSRDYSLLEWYCRHNDFTNVVIYSIDTVNVPVELVERHGSSGNKGRIIALCRELEGRLSLNTNNLIGLVDKDYDYLLGLSFSSRFLATTDFACLECYALSQRTLLKFFAVYLGKSVDADRLSELLDVAVDSFTMRAAKQILGPEAAWIEVVGYCSYEHRKVAFNRDTFIERLCNASYGKLRQKDLFAKFSELKQRISGDFRENINGHDIVGLLSWLAHKIGVPNAIYNPLPLQRALMACIELEELNTMPLFKKLATWLQEGANS